MSALHLTLGTTLVLGGGRTLVPIAATVERTTAGTSMTFGLDLGPTDPPVELSLGEVVDFLQDQIGARLGVAAGETVAAALPQVGSDLSSNNATRIELRALSLRTSPTGTSFAIGVDVVGAAATDPAIGLPADVAGWLSVGSIGLAFAVSATP